MNRLKAKVSGIKKQGSLSLVSFDALFDASSDDVHGISLKMLSLDLPQDVSINSAVVLGIKPFSVAISKQMRPHTSHCNQIEAQISEIIWGELMCNIHFGVGDYKLQSFITKDSAIRLELTDGARICALIKATDLFIEEVLND